MSGASLAIRAASRALAYDAAEDALAAGVPLATVLALAALSAGPWDAEEGCPVSSSPTEVATETPGGTLVSAA